MRTGIRRCDFLAEAIEDRVAAGGRLNDIGALAAASQPFGLDLGVDQLTDNAFEQLDPVIAT